MAGSGRSSADDTLAALIASGRTIRQAAKKAGVSERTAWRRWADPTFKQHVRQLRSDAVERCMGKLSNDMTRAATKLRQLLNAQAENVQLGAAKAMVELGLRLREQVELAERIENLEARLDTEKPK